MVMLFEDITNVKVFSNKDKKILNLYVEDLSTSPKVYEGTNGFLENGVQINNFECLLEIESKGNR